MSHASNLDDYDIQNDEVQTLFTFQKAILNSMALDGNPNSMLETLCKEAEKLVPNAIACISLLNEQRSTLHILSAPSMPKAFKKELNGLIPGHNNGSCCKTVLTGKPCYVSNTTEDETWKNLHELARDFQITSCWSTPIKYKEKTIGSFALASPKQQSPSNFQKQLLECCGLLSSVIIQHKQHESELWRLSNQDILTNLPNRKQLIIHLNGLLEIAKRYSQQVALLYIDLDNFKQINGCLGHKMGNKVLVEISNRIKSRVRGADMLCHLGGDEFVLVLEPLKTPIAAWNVAQKILDAIAEPINLNERQTHFTASIGISLYPKDGKGSDELVKNATLAKIQAKQTNGNSCVFYEHELSAEIHRRIAMEQDISHAIQSEQFELYFQPAYCREGKSVISMEVLLRWNHPTKGLLMPNKFIPIAEDSILIHQLGDWVINKAVSYISLWLDKYESIPVTAINISPVQLHTGFSEKIDATLKAHSVPAQYVEIEISESSFLIGNKASTAVKELQLLKQAGISIALDNYGTGYTPLSQLQILPINKLKIDRSFVLNLLDEKNNKTIIETILSIGKNMDIQVLAEGIETDEQKNYLVQKGCDFLQGFLLDLPMNVKQIEKRFCQPALSSRTK